MYYFIFEKSASKRLSELTRQIEDEVINRGLVGEMVELTPARNIDTLLTDANHKGYQTLVVVGDSRLVNKVASRILRYDIVLGVVPVSDSPALFKKIGVKDWKSAVIALQHRRWQYASLGRINDTGTFLTSCTIPQAKPGKITVETANYSVDVTTSDLTIATRAAGQRKTVIGVECTAQSNQNSSWWQGLLGKTKQDNFCRFSSDTLLVTTETPANVMVDQTVIGRTPATFTVTPKALRLIVAKQGMMNKE